MAPIFRHWRKSSGLAGLCRRPNFEADGDLSPAQRHAITIGLGQEQGAWHRVDRLVLQGYDKTQRRQLGRRRIPRNDSATITAIAKKIRVVLNAE
jgi:hypothetical protein